MQSLLGKTLEDERVELGADGARVEREGRFREFVGLDMRREASESPLVVLKRAASSARVHRRSNSRHWDAPCSPSGSRASCRA